MQLLFYIVLTFHWGEQFWKAMLFLMIYDILKIKMKHCFQIYIMVIYYNSANKIETGIK